eukprot:COSAG05_NODE_502_length_9214_cov_3.816676_9_plen_106_part_00
MRFHIIRNARIENVGKSQSCMVSKLRFMWKQTVSRRTAARGVDFVSRLRDSECGWAGKLAAAAERVRAYAGRHQNRLRDRWQGESRGKPSDAFGPRGASYATTCP